LRASVSSDEWHKPKRKLLSCTDLQTHASRLLGPDPTGSIQSRCVSRSAHHQSSEHNRISWEWVGQEEAIYYWREWRELQDDGTIIMKASGYDQFGAHWTGWVEIAPDGPDFGLWTWILSQEDRFPEITSGEAVEATREEHHRTA
jgi:hypothetical protein